VLAHDSVSTNHFEIRLRPEGVMLRDLGSTNGTWVGRGRLLDGSVSLYDGAIFYAGDTKLRLVQIEVGNIARSCLPSLGTMNGSSEAMREIFSLVERLAPTPITTLITGETGTGKEEVARSLHELSGRTGPFVVLDCATLPSNLAESAILGHVKGAFTGATTDRKGAFAAAQGGTVLLDEIGELPLTLQPKLLRVLDRHEVEPVGSSTTHAVDVRVLAATHRDLSQLVAEGRFRVDLLHRLRQIEVSLPPLRERPSDVAVLARHFLERARANFRQVVAAGIDDDVVHALSRRHWEGNVRELRQVVETLAHLAQGSTVTMEDFLRFVGMGRLRDMNGLRALAHWSTMTGKEATDAFMRHYFAMLFEATEGDVDKICARSDYSRKGLRGVYERLGIPWPPAPSGATRGGVRVEGSG